MRSPSPGSRSLVGMAYHNAGRVVIFGGWDGALTYYRETWTWNGSTWSRQRPNGELRSVQEELMARHSARAAEHLATSAA